MKYLFFVALTLFSMTAFSQGDCQVMVKNLKGTYVGKCKDGLAHGKGEAVGIDSYKGKFKNGYPEGKGTYTYADGSVFTGEFVKGRREGRGNYEIMVDGQKVLKEGYWEDDVYVGPKKVLPYKIKIKRSVERYSFVRVSDGNSVKIHLLQDGINNSTVEDIIIYGSSGAEQSIAHNIGFTNVEFPFTGKISYSTANKLKTARFQVVFEFEILKPGDWKISLYN